MAVVLSINVSKSLLVSEAQRPSAAHHLPHLLVLLIKLQIRVSLSSQLSVSELFHEAEAAFGRQLVSKGFLLLRHDVLYF